MRKFASLCSLSAALITTFTLVSFGQAPNKPVQILDVTLNGMPTLAQQEVRVLTSTMQPGEKSVTHTHLFPVTIYVMEGELTLNMKGKPAIVAKAGEAVIEQPGLETTAVNTSATEITKVVLFYASEAKTPFLIPVAIK
jgi:quercetin dioxygenase-like cupin family protein